MGQEKESRISEKLEVSKLKLDALLKVTTGINENLSKEELLKLYGSVIYKNLGIGKLALFICSENFQNSYINGFDSTVVDAIEWDKLDSVINGIRVVNQNDPGFLKHFDVVIPIVHKHENLAYLFLSDFEGEKLEVSPIIKHLPFVQTLTNIIVVAFENKRLYNESVKKATMQREMDLAKNMQQFLIPNDLVRNEYYEFDALYLPFGDVGGDYYDVMQLSNNKVGFCIADVSGKGISAALLMSNFQANIRSLLYTSKSLEELIIRLNKKVIASGGLEKFITLFVGVYDPNTRLLETINCGHNPPLLYQNNETIELKMGTTILGMFDVLPEVLVERNILNQNAKLLCYTDGISEITNSSGEEFGTDELIQILSKYPPEEITDMVKKRADKFRGSSMLPDDITLLSCIFF